MFVIAVSTNGSLEIRSNRPAVCPKCKSPYWDREQVVRAVKELRDREIEVRRSKNYSD